MIMNDRFRSKHINLKIDRDITHARGCFDIFFQSQCRMELRNLVLFSFPFEPVRSPSLICSVSFLALICTNGFELVVASVERQTSHFVPGLDSTPTFFARNFDDS